MAHFLDDSDGENEALVKSVFDNKEGRRILNNILKKNTQGKAYYVISFLMVKSANEIITVSVIKVFHLPRCLYYQISDSNFGIFNDGRTHLEISNSTKFYGINGNIKHDLFLKLPEVCNSYFLIESKKRKFLSNPVTINLFF